MPNNTICLKDDEDLNTILWYLSIDFTLSLQLVLIIIYILVILNFSKTATFNKLTLWPYYLMLVYSILASIQYSLGALGLTNNWFTLLYVNIGNILNTGISVQIFEWFNTYLQIMFQDRKDIDITTVVV